MTTRVESRVKTATVDHAHHKNGQDPYVTIKPATVTRDAQYLYYLVLWSELTDEVKENIDPERLADEIETVPDEYIKRVSSVDVSAAVEVGA